MLNTPLPRKLRFLIVILSGLFINQFVEGQELSKYVDPFIGTGGHGHTYPGASMPFGMVQLSPDTRLTGWDGCSAYHFLDSLVYGFSHTHLSGTGCSDYGDILLMPTTGELKWQNSEYASPFQHHNEKAEPGYYSVMLDKYQVQADLTVTKRAGMHKYTFPSGKQANILIDLKHRDEVLESSLEIVGKNEIRGLRISKAWADRQVVYFVARFSKPFKKVTLNDDGNIKEKGRKAKGKAIQVYVTFDDPDGQPVFVKIGISAVSAEGAAANLDKEMPGWDFEQIRKQARDEWNKELSKIVVEGPNEKDKTTFYTALYHAMLSPNVYMDVDGSYRGRDDKIHKAVGFDYYTVFSLWDTYRAEHPLFTLIDQKRTNDFINTFIAQYEQGGLLPVWELSANETYCMIGYHAVPVIVDAYCKGIKGYDVEKAYQACKASAMKDHFGLEFYKNNGYISADKEHESVSKTLEYAYDDWCIAQMAYFLNKKQDFEIFNLRAQSYKNLFDPESGFIRPRLSGAWYSPFLPSEVNNNYTEANAWQYTFYVPQDINGLIKLMGGQKKFVDKLDELFTTSDQVSGRQQVDISGLIGQYAHGNEPSHHMAYLYNFAGEPFKTQEYVSKIRREMYFPEPGGLCGNEDCGQMSAWYVLSSIGIYPVCPGQMQYAITSPNFEKVTLNLEDGKTFVFHAPGSSKDNIYISQTELNGQYYNRSYINHKVITNGGSLKFQLSSKPNRMWGLQEIDQPKTQINKPLIVPNPYIVSPTRNFSDSLPIQLGDVEDVIIFYTLNGTEPDSSAIRYDNKAFWIKEKTKIKAIAYNREGKASYPVSASFNKIPGGRSVRLNTTYESQFNAGGPFALIDGVRGTENWRLGNWQGYQGQDFDAVIDLGKPQVVKTISAGFLQDAGSWILFPPEVEIFTSMDGKTFSSVYKTSIDNKEGDSGARLKQVSVSPNTEARYVRVFARNYGKLPAWHLSAGEDAHLFVDEIVIE